MPKYSERVPERFTSQKFMNSELGVVASCSRIERHFPLHWHEFYELELVLKGTGTHFINGQAHPLVPGTVFLLTPADFHELLVDRGCSLTIINLKFSEAVLPEELRQALIGFAGLRKVHYGTDEMTFIRQECSQLLSELSRAHEQIFAKQTIQATLLRLLIFFYRKLASSPPQSSDCTDLHPAAASTQNAAIRKALLYIQQNYRNPLSLDEVASQVHLSSKYFSELFHAAIGASFVAYVQSVRLQFAAAMLISSRMSVTEVCFAAGFNSISHFIRTFKQKFRLSPGTYRKQRAPNPPSVHSL